MTFVVTEKCIKCKYTDCIEVCPVDCFYEGENMVIINPDECIDCGVCEPECPVGAIESENDELVKWIQLAREYSPSWPNITKRKPAPPDADTYKDEDNKYDKYFSQNPGQGTI